MNFTGLQDVKWNEVEEVGFKPLPAGVYGAKIVKSGIKDNKAGTGKNLVIEFSLLGERGVKGRKITEYISVANQNQTAVNIGLGKVKDLAKKLGKDPSELQDGSELQGQLIGVKLKVTNDEKYGDQNKVQGFVEFNEDMLTGGVGNDQDIPF